MIEVFKTSVNREDVLKLLQQSTDYAMSLYPSESNHLDGVSELSKPNVHFVAALEQQQIVAIGSVKILYCDQKYGEVKRVFVLPTHRGKGISKLIMNALEFFLLENDIAISRLETGVKQPEAIALYKGIGYLERSPFGKYEADPLSIFMEKQLCI